eukprot:scaffold19389_cov34-Prasinocladus_malaysianus.AAC.1
MALLIRYGRPSINMQLHPPPASTTRGNPPAGGPAPDGAVARGAPGRLESAGGFAELGDPRWRRWRRGGGGPPRGCCGGCGQPVRLLLPGAERAHVRPGGLVGG